MSDLVESLAEVHHQDVSLVPFITVSTEIVVELQQLGFAGELTAKSMLEIVQDTVLVVMIHDVLYHNMFEQFTANTRQANGSVVFWEGFFPLLVRQNNISLPPIIGHNSSGHGHKNLP